MTNKKRQALTDSFHGEQADLHRKIDEWRQWWYELSELGEPRFGEMTDRLRRIRDRLQTHFHHEEQSGLFQDVAEQRSDHASQCQRLLSDHQKLVDDLNCLCSRLESDGHAGETWQEAKEEFEQFLDGLEAREREEKELWDIWEKVNLNTE